MSVRDLTTPVVIYTDGGSRNNPGPAALGAHIVRGEEVLADLSEYLGVQTNNYAEYTAVIRALQWCVEQGFTDESLDVRMDSKLVVEQVQGNWKVKEPSLRPLVAQVRSLVERFPRVTFTHVRREYNKKADALVNEALDEALA